MVVNYTYTGKTGGFFWEFDPNAHILTLSGNGSMPDYEPEFYSIPTWMKFRGNVDEVRFDEGITRIGSNSFFSFDRGRRTFSGPHLKRVMFPSTLQAIGHSAFRGNPYLERVELSACESLSTVGALRLCFLPSHEGRRPLRVRATEGNRTACVRRLRRARVHRPFGMRFPRSRGDFLPLR